MFIENKEYEPFALEFKRCYKELITKLSEIWNEYDFEMSVGDPYAFPNYTKEEIEKKNNELNNKMCHQLIPHPEKIEKRAEKPLKIILL